MADAAPITVAPERTPREIVETVSCWLSEAKSIMSLFAQEIDAPGTNSMLMGAFYGAQTLIEISGRELSNLEVKL